MAGPLADGPRHPQGNQGYLCVVHPKEETVKIMSDLDESELRAYVETIAREVAFHETIRHQQVFEKNFLPRVHAEAECATREVAFRETQRCLEAFEKNRHAKVSAEAKRQMIEHMQEAHAPQAKVTDFWATIKLKPSPAQLAYEAYCNHFKAHPAWTLLPETVKQSWQAVVQALGFS